ncbi:olfactory receptor 1019-like [Spea bombifrons]|uniref:olfactory receptor 1019-like n=1 Tax=Spea bombifrons TaxID=233779 RepID=UPI00234AF91D|nr:olfactory receptor 1019-like [Spea bombifrons]
MKMEAMAYDRYVAICHPLHYFIFMSLRHTVILAAASWIIGFMDTTGHAVLISKMSFCKSYLIDHFFCDLPPLLKISCSDKFTVEMLTIGEGAIFAVLAFLLTLLSYMFIVASVLKIKSAEGRKKTFSTCISHLTCVSVFYVTITSLYMKPTSSYSLKQHKYFALLFIVLIPILNPVIYTLKNQEVKDTLKKLVHRMVIKIS